MKEVTKRWIRAAIAISENPQKDVPCPACGDAPLTVTDIEAEGVVVERKLQCPEWRS